MFGSNLAGRHGKGAALHARKFYGAEYGQGLGLTGNAYAIATKDHNLKPLPLNNIKVLVDVFLLFAESHPEMRFIVTRIGCGLAGYTNEQIAPMFKNAPKNCILDQEWMEIISRL